MSKYVTLVYKYDSDSELEPIREMALKESCRAWSLDHELHRLHLVEEAHEKGRHDLLDFIFGLVDATKYQSLNDLIAANERAA